MEGETSPSMAQMGQKMTKAQWKIWYRQLRIIKRETRKAIEDMVLFGSGAVYIGSDIPDFIMHVPIESIRIEPDES